MTALSLVFSVYGQPKMLASWFESYLAQPESDRKHVEVMVVDDHGTPHAELPDIPGISLLRVDRDIPWNQGGARNLGVMEAKGPIVLLLDPDMTLPEGMLGKFLDSARMLKPRQVVRPILRHVATGVFDVSSPNLHLISRKDFLAVQGYDLGYQGHKGWSDVELLHVMHRACFVRQVDSLWLWLHHQNPDIPDAQVTTLDRDVKHNHAIHKARMGKLRQVDVAKFLETHHSPLLNFPWTRKR
jgi:glycosyltransferase involved in cell wall biosynthesis